MQSNDRRKFLLLTLHVPAVVLAGSAFAECVDSEELSDSLVGMRESMEYTATSSDPKTVCGGCMFFKPKNPADACGPCEVLQSPVNRAGHCVSWTRRV